MTTTTTKRAMAVCLAIAASAALFFVLLADSSTARAQTNPTPTQVVGEPVVVLEKSIPEDWPAGQDSDIIISFEAYATGDSELEFTFKESDNTEKFELLPTRISEDGHYIADLKLKEGEDLDYETQDTYLIGVLISAGEDAVTEILLRLKITDVDETVAPSPEPVDECVHSLDTSGLRDITGTWDSSCVSEKSAPSGGTRYARFYTFTLTESADVTITLTSKEDTYLYLLNDFGKDGVIESENDDIAVGSDTNSRIQVTGLQPGDYTIEATTYNSETSGSFRLVVEGLPAATQPGPSPSPTASPSPSPTSSPSPTPSVTPIAPPTDACTDHITGDATIRGIWDGNCVSEKAPLHGSGNRYAYFYVFALTEAADVTITLTSAQDTYLYLMRGFGKDGTIEAENDDIVRGDTNSEIEATLPAGDYTIEATTYNAETTGTFRLVVQGLPGDPQPLRDCRSGSAVTNAETETELVMDCQTLLGLVDGLAGSALLDWSADTPIEEWQGITVGSSPRRVIGLNLDQSDLNGSIPGALADLTDLKSLSLDDNRLRGIIPDELGGLSNLTELSLENNNLGDEIPVELGNLTSLRTLSLADNRLSGTIPAELGRLTRLRTLSLADNQLSGAIPAELLSLINLEELYISGNTFSGCIPAGLSDIATNDFPNVGLDFCVTGSCSTGNAVENPEENTGLASDCRVLLAVRNTLAGRTRLNWSADIPIEHWEGITVGGTPKRVTQLTLDQRGLSGQIPHELGMLSGLRIISLSDNQLDGIIPPQLGNLRNLQWLYLSKNQLLGEIPPDLGNLNNLEILFLDSNRLSGRIPHELGNLSSLEAVHLQNNVFDGQIPSQLGRLGNLVDMKLSDNLFSGSIPSELGSLPSLKEMYLDNNQLSGSIPSELGGLTTLEKLYLGNNDLIGPIPRELGSMAKLEELSLSDNQLVDEIPPELASIPNLRILRIGGNLFSGCIPYELQRIPDHDLVELVALGQTFCGEGRCAAGTAVTNPSESHGLVSDCEALLNAKDRLRGAAALNWSTDLPIEFWEGVVISGTPKRVTELNLQDSDLNGQISSALGGLSKLKTLQLSDNQLTGSVPSNLVRLVSLEVLSLSNNSLSGDLPYELGRLTKLKELYLAGNQLSGCVPDVLEDVEKNDFDTLGLTFCGKVDCSTGTAIDSPDENPGLVSDCAILLAGRDELAGDVILNWGANVPIEDWDGVTVGGTTERVTQLKLDEKELNGEIPPEFGGLIQLQVLSLANNQLIGRIPSEIGDLTSLKTLALNDNLLSGEVPLELAVLNNLEVLKLSGNNLRGCVPENLREVQDNDLDMLGLSDCVSGACSTGAAVENPDANPGLVSDCNALLTALSDLNSVLNWSSDVPIEDWEGVTIGGSPGRVIRITTSPFVLGGEVSPAFGKLSKLQVLSLIDGRLTGTIPTELSNLTNLTDLTLANNRLTGTIPTELTTLSKLITLNLLNNRLTGTVPTDLQLLGSLNTLNLSGNLLSGDIPSELGKISSLKQLYMSNNRLSGNTPTELGDLANLTHLYLRGNQLTGAIPTELGQLSNLTHLHMTSNELTGGIPVELGSLSNLEDLLLSNNQLTGTIPSELGGLSDLTRLYLSRNRLTGDIPSEMGNLSNLEELYLAGNSLTGCIPTGLKDVTENDLSLLNLQDCEAGNE